MKGFYFNSSSEQRNSKIKKLFSSSNVLKSLGTKLKIIDNIQLEIMLYDFYDIQISFYSIEKILRKYGFKLYDICYISKNPKNLRTDWVDVIYSKI